tara:strand:+ start:798 stop:1583 length:786 start_codon:yes stop_codon:yes gene_type:complete
MFELQFLVLGLVQGITEFLPISSSAHLILISELTEWKDQGIFTDIAVHVGTLGAVILYLLKEIKKIIFDFFKFKNNSNFFFIKIIIATLPALIIGFIVYEYFILYFRNLIVIAWSSIIFAIILFIADRKINSHKSWEQLNFFEVFVIGLWQSLAFIPGASRAGVTITGARFLSIKRDSAAIFSMLLSIPIILASLSLSLIDLYIMENNTINVLPSIFSAFVAFFTALISIHMMMKILKVTNFNIFIIYRILLGIALLLFYA